MERGSPPPLASPLVLLPIQREVVHRNRSLTPPLPQPKTESNHGKDSYICQNAAAGRLLLRPGLEGRPCLRCVLTWARHLERGDSAGQARSRLREAAALFLEEAASRGTLTEILAEAGFKKRGNTATPDS